MACSVLCRKKQHMTTRENIFTNFKFTMSGLEKGLQVIHITTPSSQLLCCQHSDDIETVLVRPDLSPFDQIPVKEHETIVGLLKRRECSEAKGLAKDHMQPLGEKILVSADTPLLDFLQNDSLDRMVIGGTTIYGLVTRSDLLKLPVFLLGFALVTHVETLMLNIIRNTSISENVWLAWLKRGRRIDIQQRFDELISQRSDINMLGLTYFHDKSKILEQLAVLEEYTSRLPDKNFITQLEEIKLLRNTIVHTGNTDDNDNILQTFIDRLRMTYKWIEDIEHWQKTQTSVSG
jgi:hypothetical protein